jgi:hypothetical protein
MAPTTGLLLLRTAGLGCLALLAVAVLARHLLPVPPDDDRRAAAEAFYARNAPDVPPELREHVLGWFEGEGKPLSALVLSRDPKPDHSHIEFGWWERFPWPTFALRTPDGKHYNAPPKGPKYALWLYDPPNPGMPHCIGFVWEEEQLTPIAGYHLGP